MKKSKKILNLKVILKNVICTLFIFSLLVNLGVNLIFAQSNYNKSELKINEIKKVFSSLDIAYKKGEVLNEKINNLSLSILDLNDDPDINRYNRSKDLIDTIRNINKIINSYSFTEIKKNSVKNGKFNHELYEDTKKRINNLKTFLSELTEKLNIAEKGIIIYRDGIKLTQKDSSAFIEKSRTLVPLRLISESLGAEVKWLNEERAVVIIKDDTVLYIPLNSTKYLKNNVEYESSVPAGIVNDRTYVPVRFVSEAIGITVDWEQPFPETGIVFLFTKGQSRDEITRIKKRIIEQTEKEIRPLTSLESKAYKSFDDIKNTSFVEAITTTSKYTDGIRYETSDLLEKSIQFLEEAEGKTRKETINLIDNLRGINDLSKIVDGLSYDDFSFLKHQKYLIYDVKKVFAGKDYFNLYLTAIDKKTSSVSYINFKYAQSERFKNDIGLHGIKISKTPPEINLKDEYVKDSEDEKKTYQVIFGPSERIWTASAKSDLTRTSFSIQKKLKDGSYSSKEIISTHIEKDDWDKNNIIKKYRNISEDLAKKIIDLSNLNDIEKRKYISSGYRINIFAEISAISPEDIEPNWYRIYDLETGESTMLRIFKDKNKSLIFNRIKAIENLNKPLNDEYTGYLTYEVAGKKTPNWELNVRFVNADTGTEIKNPEKYTNETDTPPFVYTPEENIGGVYKITDSSKRLFHFKDNSDDLETMNLVLEYKPVDQIAEKPDLLIDEWRLSKYINDISKALGKEEKVKIKADFPKQNNYNKYLFFPFSEQKIIIKGNENLPHMTYKHLFEKSLWTSIKSLEEGIPASCPVYLKKDFKKYPFTLSENTTINKGFYYEFNKDGEEPKEKITTEQVSDILAGTVKLKAEIEKTFGYMPIAEKISGIYSDGAPKKNYEIDDKINIKPEYYDAIYNFTVGVRNYITKPKENPKKIKHTDFKSKTVKNGETIFERTEQSDTGFNVRPDVMMIYDTEFGETEACFVKGKELRKVNPVSYNTGFFDLEPKHRLKTNDREDTNDKDKMKALANALGKPELPVIPKSEKIDFYFESAGGLIIKTYSLDISKPELKERWKSKEYNTKKIREDFLNKLYSSQSGMSAVINASILVGDKEYSGRTAEIILKKKESEDIKTHKIEIRGGKIRKIDDYNAEDAPKYLKNVLDKMHLTAESENNPLSTFAIEEGDKLNDKKYSELSLKNRGVEAKLEKGWYSEDTVDLVIVETTDVFEISPTNFEFIIPSEITGLETPLDEQMKYSRGELSEIKLELVLKNTGTSIDLSPKDKLFIIPNADKK